MKNKEEECTLTPCTASDTLKCLEMQAAAPHDITLALPASDAREREMRLPCGPSLLCPTH